jgi:hypothetical protein
MAECQGCWQITTVDEAADGLSYCKDCMTVEDDGMYAFGVGVVMLMVVLIVWAILFVIQRSS